MEEFSPRTKPDNAELLTAVKSALAADPAP